MSIFPIITARKLIPIFLKLGFKIVRQKGSHIHLEQITDATRKITIPMHNYDLPKKTILFILKQAKIPLIEFLKIIGRK